MPFNTTGSITIEIGPDGQKKPFTLAGTVGSTIQVGWRAKDGDAEVRLGSLPDIIVSVYTALTGGDADFKTKLDALIASLMTTPLAPVATLLTQNQVYITDLAISAVADATGYSVSSAAFGFRVTFDDATVGPFTLKGFGVLFEYEKGKTGNLTSLPEAV